MDNILFKTKRQDDPSDLPYWEKFYLPYEPGLTIIGALSKISEDPVAVDGNSTVPIRHETSCGEGICGSCTMVINGKVRQACRTKVEDLNTPITIEPLSKFPVVRDLVVDRTRMFDAIEMFSCWNDVDCENMMLLDYNIISTKEVDRVANYIGCMMCGACLEACPQINSRSPYVGAFVFSQAMALNLVPSGLDKGGARISASMHRGGLADCGASGNCFEVCPAGIDLPAAISEFGYIAGRYSLRSFLRG